MNDTKRRVEIFSFHDHTGLESHLERMASNGWLLDKVNSFFWTYHRIAPRKLHFSVTYFPNTSEFDPVLTEEQQTFADFCREAGWRLAATSAQIQIFYSEEENPVPIETDALTQVDNIHRAMKRSFLPSQLFLLLIGLLQIAMTGWSFHRDPVGALDNPFRLLSFLPWLLVVILCSTDMITYLRWHKQARIAALEDGTFLPTHSTRNLQIIALVILGCYLVFWFVNLGSGMYLVIGLLSILCVALLILAVNLIKYILKKKQVSKNVNRTVTIAACFFLSFALSFALTLAVIHMNQAGWFDGGVFFTEEP